MLVAAFICLATVLYCGILTFTPFLGPAPFWSHPLFWLALVVMIVLLFVRKQRLEQAAYEEHYHDTIDRD